MVRKLATWVVGLASGAGVGLFYTGNIGYGFHRTPEWIDQQLVRLPQVKELNGKLDKYKVIKPWQENAHMPSKVFNVPGGISSPVVYSEKSNPGHTYMFTYLGGKTCGYPFLVHGGVLGTLIEDAFAEATMASRASNWNKIEIIYRKPTFSGQFVSIETKQIDNGKLEAVVYSQDGKRLVQAVAI